MKKKTKEKKHTLYGSLTNKKGRIPDKIKKVKEIDEEETYTPPDSIRVIRPLECDVADELAKLDGYDFERRHREFGSYGDY